MRLLDRLMRNAPPEAFNASQAYGRTPFTFGRYTTTGALITVDSAVELIPVYSAVNLISSAIGSLPCKVYSYAGAVRSDARGSRQWRMLHDTPNDEIAADEFWQWVSSCLLLWGNAFIWKERDANGVVQNLWPIRPDRVMVGRETVNGKSRPYFLIDSAGRFYDVDILHIRGFGTDGIVGYSPIQIARQQFANDLAQQEFLGTFMKNGLFSSAVFTHPNRLSQDAQERLRDQIEDRSGWLSAGKAITLEEGADLKNLTMSLVDSEFVQLVKLGEHRVAQLYGLVPPHQWGATDQSKSVTYQNSEFGGLEFVKWTLRQWLVRLESAIGRDQGIFPSPGPTLFPEFLVDALLRADTSTRWTAYNLGFNKWINAEWIQQTENITLPEGSTLPPPTAPTDQGDGGVGGDQGGADATAAMNGRKVLA